MLPIVRQSLGLPSMHLLEPCQPQSWQLYRHISVHSSDNDCLAGKQMLPIQVLYRECQAAHAGASIIMISFFASLLRNAMSACLVRTKKL